MPFSEPITFDLIIPSMIAANQKQVFRMIGHEISKAIGIQERIISDRLLENEKHSDSALGGGIAVSHMHIASLNKPLSIFVKLRSAIDYNAPDNVAVDMICLLLTPEREGASYLRDLARLSRIMRDTKFCHKLRLSEDERAIRSLFEGTITRIAA
jgi:PTS system nitrogen regulatory IIA component